ncbi:phosphoadenosine phosphosulfate reductase [Symbiobacterium terraclitae]|uniref:Adenosine 5'-phosphosulfate reductase n=1 Tax=Symbiobacterium terraclitae TaxID=557451 RepID=A0ABS4JNV0_9FIRM|nr:phosphoadenylyl-sulfate reductase [Symbiobacterium terraclitae]MBP2017218.1 phosphoadenosine phosphosulfate reductase [Symbiobacterium terraclitae]
MADKRWTPEELAAASAALEGQGPVAALRWAYEHFAHDEIALACSFGAEDVALVDMISKLAPEAQLFYLDTNFLFPETYQTIEAVRAAYPLRIRQVLPSLTPEEQAAQYGDELWRRDPDACCSIRKVQPLTQVLSGLKAWITGIRREQSPTRANAQVVEWDRKFGLVKINPLVAWKDADVWKYILENNVPYNPLHDQGYPSIGCTHCTRAVRPGEDPRAGRWSGFQKTECGLHA